MVAKDVPSASLAKMRIWFFGLFLAISAPCLSQAQENAPLPPHFVLDEDSRTDGQRLALPDVRGIFAHGVVGVAWQIDLNGAPCVGTRDEQERLIGKLPGGADAEFWLYRTQSQAVLFQRTAVLDPKKRCEGALWLMSSMERGFVADGVVHTMNVETDNQLEPNASLPLGHTDGAYAGGFNLLHNLMARPKHVSGATRRVSDRIAGIRATCHDSPGLVWDSVCLANSGPANGMILRAQAGDDEQVLFNLEIRELKTGVALPGVVFDVERSWRMEGGSPD
jgi:hypothetical protein